MNFLTAFHTDVGIKKKTNQDSLLIHQAQTECGNVLFAAICDGMGGLAKGEVASACMIRMLSDWFSRELPGILSAGLQPETLRGSWERVVAAVNQKITNYSIANNVSMGTTCTALLIANETYQNNRFEWITLNSGDYWTVTSEDGGNTIYINFANILKEKSQDGVYTVEVSGRDYAGNVTELTPPLVFSLNRFGSSFVISDPFTITHRCFTASGKPLLIPTAVSPLL